MENKATSLLSLFLPPDRNLKGYFGLLCGFSASEDFLDRAMENFTTMNSAQRAELGSLNLALFLDKRKKQITSVSRLHHAMFKGKDGAFSLMHAKVGFLTFSKNKFSPIEAIRIFVSTANWTRIGMIENLDLAWKLDIKIDDKDTSKGDVAEIRKVLEYFKELIRYYPLLKTCQEQVAKIEAIIPPSSSKESGVTRFFSTFDKIDDKPASVLQCVKRRFERANNARPFNILICGSGFYEHVLTDKQNVKTDNLQVLKLIEKTLCATSTFTKRINGFIVANPIDYWKFKPALESDGKIDWEIRKFEDHADLIENQLRTFLHAKYIFAGYLHNDRYPSAQLYIGSGNLSKKGFTYTLSQPEGNIEAGVVVDASEMTDDQVDIALCVSDESIEANEIPSNPIQSTPEYLEEETQYAAPMRAIVDYDSKKRTGRIEWGEDPDNGYFLGTSSPEKFKIKAGQDHIEFPPHLELKGHLGVFFGENTYPQLIPIISTDGRYCITPPNKVDAESILSLLLTYPEFTTGSDDSDESDIGGAYSAVDITKETLNQSSARTLSTAMELIESIARKNQDTHPDLLLGWFEQLTFTLVRCLKDDEKKKFQEVRRNFLSILKETHFAPNWSGLDDAAPYKLAYSSSIDQIASDWGIDAYPGLTGGPHDQ